MTTSSWDILTYSDEIQLAFRELYEPPLNLQPLHDGPYHSDTEYSVYTSLHTFLTDYPLFFPDFIHEYIQDRDLLQAHGPAAGRLTRGLSPLVKFQQILATELKNVQEIHEKLVFSQFESLGKDDPKPNDDEGMEVDWKDVRERVGDSIGLSSGSSVSRDPSPCPPGNLAIMSPLKRSSDQNDRAVLDSGLAKRRRSIEGNGLPVAPVRAFTKVLSTDTETSVSDSSNTPVWSPISAKPVTHDTVLLLPRNDYQHSFAKYDIAYHVQWELERLLATEEDLTWGDFRMEYSSKLQGSSSAASVGLEAVLSDMRAGRPGVSSAAWSSRSASVTGRKARLLREVDMEERSIRTQDLRGVGTDDPNWSYGGRIAYTVIIRPTKTYTSSCITFLPVTGRPTPPTSIQSSSSDSTVSVHSEAGTSTTDIAEYNPLDSSRKPQEQTVQPKHLFTAQLCQPQMPGKSFRLARRFGSRRILTLKLKYVNSPRLRREIFDLCVGTKLILLGRCFRAIWAPSDRDAIIAIEVGDHIPGITFHNPLNPPMPGLEDVLAMYNDLRLKPSQAMAKWASRPQLLFSDSVPAVTLYPEAICVIPDIISHLAQRRGGSPSTEEILTDGCGLMSQSLAQRIYNKLTPDAGRPCVLQVRIQGAKGLLAVMTTEQERLYPGIDVVLRKSMVKSYSAPEYPSDPSLLTLDVVRFGSATLKVGTSISSEAIIAMTHGGIPVKTFLRLAELSLDKLRDDFLPTPLEGESETTVIARLVSNLYRRGAVGVDRKKRACAAEGKSEQVTGLVMKSKEINDEVLTGGDQLIDPVERYDIDPISGRSGSIAESLMMALLAGFHPLQSAYAGTKLHHFMRTQVDRATRDFRIPVDESLSAYIIPDPFQILRPHEIFVSFSSAGPIDPNTHCPMSYLLGECLVYRSPAKLPTDVQKMTAVFKPELAHLKDCIVMSASAEWCTRSPASFLAGGDYDGDTASVFWSPDLVEPFQNADEKLADVPVSFESENFEKDLVKGHDFLEAIGGMESNQRIANMQSWLLGAVLDDKSTGQYSDLHGNAVYKLGFAHPESIRLARMFCHVLDARKSGLRVKPEVKKRDLQKYAGVLDWRSYKKNETEERGELTIRRAPRMGHFIMDLIMDASKAQGVEIMRHFPSQIPIPSSADYDALSPLFLNAERHPKSTEPQLAVQIDKLKKHVSACIQIWERIRQRRLAKASEVDQLYTALLNGSAVHPSPRHIRSGKKGGYGSPVRQNSSTSSISTDGSESDLLLATQMRNLAKVWKERLILSDVPDLCHFGDEGSLRRMKISFAVCSVPSHLRSKQLFPFDVDFTTTCAMKAESQGGGAMTMMTEMAMIMKPG